MKLLYLLLLLLFIINVSTTTPNKELSTIDSNKDVKVILIMAYKRIDDFKICIDSIINANHSSEYHLIITQSVSMNDNTYFNLLSSIITSKQLNNKFKSVTHLSTDSSSKLPYGNAYFAFKNLIYGLKSITSSLFPNVQNVIIFEEDVDISLDTFEFFDASSKLINSPTPNNKIKFATTAFFLHTTHNQYNWKLDKPIKRKSIRNEQSLSLLVPNELIKVTLNGEIEFKVLSWMIERSIINQLIQDFNIIENWVIENKYEDKIENKPNTSKPEILVNNCDCWNHDRYLEMRFKGMEFIGSQSPRCNHVPVGGYGLSSVLDDYGFPLNQVYVKSNDFKQGAPITGEKGIWNIVKEYLPKFECPSIISCYNNQTNQQCGTLHVSTCLNIYALECTPCSGRHVSTLQPQCNHDFTLCCKNNCQPHNPFFISIPSLTSSS